MADPGALIQLPHVPDRVLYVALFKDVKNSAFLRQQLIQGNTDFEYAFLDATSVNTSDVLVARDLILMQS